MLCTSKGLRDAICDILNSVPQCKPKAICKTIHPMLSHPAGIDPVLRTRYRCSTTSLFNHWYLRLRTSLVGLSSHSPLYRQAGPPTAPVPMPKSLPRDEPEAEQTRRGIPASRFEIPHIEPSIEFYPPYRLGTRKDDTISTKPIAIVLQLSDSNTIYHISIPDECTFTKSTLIVH
jgi:hypothetical protein